MDGHLIVSALVYSLTLYLSRLSVLEISKSLTNKISAFSSVFGKAFF